MNVNTDLLSSSKSHHWPAETHSGHEGLLTHPQTDSNSIEAECNTLGGDGRSSRLTNGKVITRNLQVSEIWSRFQNKIKAVTPTSVTACACPLPCQHHGPLLKSEIPWGKVYHQACMRRGATCISNPTIKLVYTSFSLMMSHSSQNQAH